MNALTNVQETLVIDWSMTLLRLRSKGVTTASIWQTNNIDKGSIEGLLYNDWREPRHSIGEMIINKWLQAGFLREELPMRPFVKRRGRQ